MAIQDRSITKFGRFDLKLRNADHAIERMMAAKHSEWTSSASRRGPLIPAYLCNSEGTEPDAPIRRHLRCAGIDEAIEDSLAVTPATLEVAPADRPCRRGSLPRQNTAQKQCIRRRKSSPSTRPQDQCLLALDEDLEVDAPSLTSCCG